MAHRVVAISPYFGGAALVALLSLSLGTILAVAWQANGLGLPAPSDWAALRFTVFQACLSATLSCILAIPVARALARRTFPGRRLLITLLGAPFLLPVIVAILGLLIVFGRAGLVNTLGGRIGLPEVRIYGLHGILLAHVFFNLPLVTRLLLQGWQAIPPEHMRLVAGLGAGPRMHWRVLEWPLLKRVLPGAFCLVFILCLTSFAVVLALGGGPRATTLELAIFEAIRFDFDLGQAAVLALLQVALCLAAALVTLHVPMPQAMTAFGTGALQDWTARGPASKSLDAIWICLAAVFLLVPLSAIIARGLPNIAVWATLGPSAWLSVQIALASAVLATGGALALGLWIGRMGRAYGAWIEGLGILTLAASPLVMGTGLFILLYPIMPPKDATLPVVMAVNAALTIPFGLRALVPAIRQMHSQSDRLATSLRLPLLGWVRWVMWPSLRRPLGFTAGLSAALSMGDLGVVALFAPPDTATLPLAMYRLMGAYRMADAAAAGVLLLCLTFALFWIFDRLGQADA